MQKAKWLSEEALQIAVKEKKQKAKEKQKDIPIWMQSSKEYQGEIKKPSSVINGEKQRKTTEWAFQQQYYISEENKINM